MNHNIRKFLIDQCVLGNPIYYEVIAKKLDLNLGLESDRFVLSKILGELSAYEYQAGRPLISAIAIYKLKNDHGYGFYKLCEQLGIGNANKLKRELYGFTQIEACKQYWQKEENHRAFYSIQLEKPVHNLDFFSSEELIFLSNWAGKTYDKDNQEHVAAKNYIINSLGTKTQYWSNEIVRRIPGLDTFNWRMWSRKGWQDTDNGKVRVAKFKHYTWARIYRIGDEDKDIFFTVGTDSNRQELVYKLDYYFEKNSHLNASQKELAEQNIPTEIRWKGLSAIKIKEFNWDLLLDLTTSFISEHLHIYDRLIDLVWGESRPEETFTNFLRLQNTPQSGIASLPDLKPSFEGIRKDFLAEAIEKKEIGDAGEQLVKKYEETRLRNYGHTDLAAQVAIVEDGKGYDILSFHEDRSPKYIEVKTTRGNSLTPFDYTINEKLFAVQHSNSYYIYRLYNYNAELNTADFYTIREVDQSLLLQPTSFRAYLRKKN